MDKQHITYIFDFDKTIISVEGLEVLADTCLINNANKEKIMNKISLITEQGMNGQIPFDMSLKMRFDLIRPTGKDIQKTISKLLHKITPSVYKNKRFFKENAGDIYIVSGGFKEYIIPVVQILGIPKNHILANTIKKDVKGTIIGFDETNPLSKENGKVEVVNKLQKKYIIAIGDGYTDAHLKIAGAVAYFVAFTENVARKNVMAIADEVVKDFDEFLMSDQFCSNRKVG